MSKEPSITLIPQMPGLQLVTDPDRRRQRENERRIEEYLRARIAADTKAQSSYARRFLVME